MPEQTNEQLLSKLQFWHRQRLPMIHQSEATECGLACLAMIAGYHGYHTDITAMRAQFNVSMSGTTLLDVMNFADKLALTGRPLKLEMEDLSALKTPCILHWDLNHFVVLKQIKGERVYIHDPAHGEVQYTMAETSRHFTGIALELTPTQEFKSQQPPASLKFSDFWRKITGLKRSLALIFTLSLLLQIFALASPYYIQLVIDDVIFTGDTKLLTVLAMGFGLVLLFEVATHMLRGFTLLHFGQLMNIQLGANLFHHLLRLPLNFFEKRHMGDIMSRFGSLTQVKQLLTTGMIEALIDGLMAIITLGMIFFYSPKLACVVLITVFIYALLRIMLFKPFRAVSEQEIVAKAEEHSNFMETIRGIQTIKLFGSEVKREGLWQNRYANSINQTIRIGHYKISFDAVNRTLFGIENILVIYLAAGLVLQGGFSTGMLFAFMAYKRQFIDKTASLIAKYIEFRMLGLHFERLADIALAEKENLANNAVKNHEINGKISIKNLHYRYAEGLPNIVENISLDIAAGESIAITGPSGCGKSTLMKLMLGLSQPNSGEILIDDIPLEQIGHKQYRNQIAAVMQDDQLLSGSIADNIAFFDSPIDMKKVVKCANMAAIDEDIQKMPMGYDSLIGDMGSSLSGGQKQRLILARALYREPKILFMDEATSHLDTQLESNINQAVKHLSITRVIIAHRQETIDSADRVIDLNTM